MSTDQQALEVDPSQIQPITVDPSQGQPVPPQPIEVDPSQIQPTGSSALTVDVPFGPGTGGSISIPIDSTDASRAAAAAFLETSKGVPIFPVQRQPTSPEGQPEVPAWTQTMPQGQQDITDLPRQGLSALYGASANSAHLIANLFHLLDAGADQISQWSGQPKGNLFQQIENWAKAQQQGAQQSAWTLAGKDYDPLSNLYRNVATSVFNMPAYATAAELGGPVPVFGMAGIGALETADQGTKNMMMGALQGGLQGGAMHVLGPGNRIVRLVGNAAASYANDIAHHVDPSTAFWNAMTVGGMSAIPKGGMTIPGADATIAPRRFGDIAPQWMQNIPQRLLAPSPQAQSIINLGKQYGITRMTPGDITQQPWLMNTEVNLEKLPLSGMQSLRQQQNLEISAAAARLRSRMWQNFRDADPSSASALEAAAQSGDELARNVQEKMDQAGEDPHRVTQASIALGDWMTRQEANDRYDKVENLADQHNLGDVPMDATTKAINGALEQLRPAKLKNNEVIGTLQTIKNSINPKRVAPANNPFPEGTMAWRQFQQGRMVKPDNSYGLIRQLHSDLGDRIRDYYQGNNALIGEKGVGYLERAQNAIEDDLRNYAENSGVPEIVEAGRNADEYYKTARVPYKNGMITRAATTTEPDTIWKQFITAYSGNRAEQFYKALDEKGRAAVRYSMVNDAMEKALNPATGIFSPQKFFSAVEKLKGAYGVFFKGSDRAQIEGFKNLMAHVTRAGQYAENPPTGQRVVPWLIGEKVASAFPGALGVGAAAAGLARGLFTTETGRNLLLKMARVKPATPLMESLWRQAAEEVPKQTQPPEEPPSGPIGEEEPPEEPPAGGGAAATPPGGSPVEPGLAGRLKAMGDAATERMRQRGTFGGGTSGMGGGMPMDDIKDMVTWMATRIGQGAVEAADIPDAIRAQFGKLPLKLVNQIGGQAKDLAGRMVRMQKADPAAGSEQSTRVPTAVKATEDPISNILTTGYESWKRDPEMMKKNVNAMLEYPNFHGLRKQVRSGKVSIPDAAEQIIGHIQENLQWLHDAMPEEFRDRARLWYDGANKIAKRWGGKYGATPEQVAGLMAVTSPGTDWFINAERARRELEFWQDRDSKKWDPRMETTWRDKLSSAIPEDIQDQVYKDIQGKDFKDVTPEARPIWFRLHDEAINPREYHTLNPEGTWGDFSRTEKGALSQFNWADFNQIEKGLSILENGSKENIHAQLGLNHKIRNFYNNIINPNSPREHTTIDTHAVGAGLMRPISQMSIEAGQNFGGSGASSSSISGEKGTYGLWKEAYRRAAAANNVLPREMQSITWEAIRSLFSRKFKGSAANVDAINSLWEGVSTGKITADEARQRALKFAGGFDRPAWFRGRWDTGLPKGKGTPGQSR